MRQRTTSPGAKDDDERVVEVPLPLRTTLTRGRCVVDVEFFFREKSRVGCEKKKGDNYKNKKEKNLLTSPAPCSSTLTLPTRDETTEPLQECVPGPGACVDWEEEF
jgi:hypothetical protein